MTQAASPPLTRLAFRTAGLPAAEAFAHWREVMAPLFHIEQARYSSVLPDGELTVFLVGDLMVNRCTFNAQHLTRDPTLIAATPNHLVLQYYRSGGFRGAIAGRPVTIMRGQVAVCDLGEETDAYAATSDTVGLSVPKALLKAIDPAALHEQLDAPRNRLLGGFMNSLPRRLARMSEDDIPNVTAEVTRVLAKTFAPGDLGDAAAATLDENLRARALALVEAHLAEPDLSPALLAERTGASRGTLYRLFTPMGGIMRYIQERRLDAVRDVLDDPLDRRPLLQLAPLFGFSSQALLSRAFRERFGLPPSAWREQQGARDLARRETAPDAAHGRWRKLGG